MSTDTNTFESHEAQTRLAQVLGIVRESGADGAPRWHIAARTRIRSDLVYDCCVELQKRGLVHTKRLKDGSVWREGPNPKPTAKQLARAEFGPLGAMPRQTTVSTWTPHHERDPLVAIFFGGSK